MLTLMGVPVIDAPCEVNILSIMMGKSKFKAEAQCAELVRKGKVYATATEDMDALTFGSQILVRHMTFSEAKKMPIKVFIHSLLIVIFKNKGIFIGEDFTRH